MRAGAALDLRDRDGKTALQLAQEKGRSAIVTILQEAAAAAAEMAAADPELVGLLEGNELGHLTDM